MKPKTIKAVLKRKFNEWADSIEEEPTRDLVKRHTIITGGCITSMLLGEVPKDYDVYFKNKKTTLAVARYYCKKWNAVHGEMKNRLGIPSGIFTLDGEDVERWKRGKAPLSSIAPCYKQDIEYEKDNPSVSHMITNTPPDRVKIIYPSDGVVGEGEVVDNLDEMDETPEGVADLLNPPKGNEESEGPKKKYRPVFFTTNAITLSDQMQLILRFYGSPEVIHKTYDFEHCCCYWQSKNEELELPNEALIAIINKNLHYRGSLYPICSIFRAKKFIKRGWNINAGQFVKMAFQISQLDLTDIDVLEDQLIGVDTVYFTKIVDALRLEKEKNAAFHFDGSYLATVVDRVFG